MLIPNRACRDESSYLNGEHCKVKSSRIARGFRRVQITRKSAENPAKILRFSQIGT
jgi:hypothetical protein